MRSCADANDRRKSQRGHSKRRSHDPSVAPASAPALSYGSRMWVRSVPLDRTNEFGQNSSASRVRPEARIRTRDAIRRSRYGLSALPVES